MNRVLKILFLSIATITVCAVKAQTVMWSIPPIYDCVEEYAPGMYLCTQDEKQGIIFVNKEIKSGEWKELKEFDARSKRKGKVNRMVA